MSNTAKSIATTYLIIFSIVAINANAQESDDSRKTKDTVIYGHDLPVKGDKKIVIVCLDSLDNLYKRFGRHLALKGYAIENSDKDFLTIKTALRPTSKWNFSYFLNSVVEGKTVVITVQWKLNSSILAGTRDSGFSDWEYHNNKTTGMTVTVNSVIYTDLMKYLEDFDKVGISYK